MTVSSHPPPSSPEATRVSVVAAGPPHPAAKLPLLTASGSAAAASYRLLRYKIEKHAHVRTIAVTSPGRNEGKTTCAINLALALAERSLGRVLLIEANLQYPKLAPMLGFAPSVCFGEQMRSAAQDDGFSWQVAAPFMTNLHILAVDPSTTRSQLLNGPLFQNAIERLANLDYTHAVLDCPPVLTSADVNIIADTVDGILLSALAKNTRKSALRDCVASLEPANILGSVLLGG